MNEVVEVAKDKTSVSEGLGVSPMDAYCAEMDVSVTLQLLLDNGWTVFRDHGHYWDLCRPGKDKGVSATLNFYPDVFYCFTSNTDFESGKAYSTRWRLSAPAAS